MTTQTAGRDNLGRLAPTFAALNDDVLFGQVWSREEALSARDRSLITCASLMSQGLFPQLEAHLRIAQANGITQSEMVEVITQLAFYAGWPKAWSAFALVEQVWGADPEASADPLTPTDAAAPTDHGPFPLGDPADGPNFTGHAWLSMMSRPDDAASTGNVTFAPGCVNRWHTHPHGQILLVTAGHGWEQQDGLPARELHPGDVVRCAPGIRHWHGAAADSSMTHIAITPVAPGEPAVRWEEFPETRDVPTL